MLKALYTPKKCILSSKRVQSYKLRRKNQIYKPKISTKSLILRHLWSLLLLFTQISHHFKSTDVHKTVYLKAIFDLKAYPWERISQYVAKILDVRTKCLLVSP